MSEFTIRAKGLGKKFSGTGLHPSRAMHDLFERMIRGSFTKPNDFWALRDVSFDVRHGESIGIVGSNGAGKSILLKILSRVTAPTEGRAEIFGHIAPLLEVGAGFHPELSGRENVYFNGAILGMGREEVRRNFDEIVAFSEIEAFIDTPIKLYSSGMRMRLAFSVAAHLDSDILVIDEAFAVGDANFRAKCRRKIVEFIDRGCTLLLVSHDTAVISELCERAILLEHGRMIADGPTAEILKR